jgi:hypothetical protein
MPSGWVLDEVADDERAMSTFTHEHGAECELIQTALGHRQLSDDEAEALLVFTEETLLHPSDSSTAPAVKRLKDDLLRRFFKVQTGV